ECEKASEVFHDERRQCEWRALTGECLGSIPQIVLLAAFGQQKGSLQSGVESVSRRFTEPRPCPGMLISRMARKWSSLPAHRVIADRGATELPERGIDRRYKVYRVTHSSPQQPRSPGESADCRLYNAPPHPVRHLLDRENEQENGDND